MEYILTQFGCVFYLFKIFLTPFLSAPDIQFPRSGGHVKEVFEVRLPKVIAVVNRFPYRYLSLSKF